MAPSDFATHPERARGLLDFLAYAGAFKSPFLPFISFSKVFLPQVFGLTIACPRFCSYVLLAQMPPLAPLPQGVTGQIQTGILSSL